MRPAQRMSASANAVSAQYVVSIQDNQRKLVQIGDLQTYQLFVRPDL